MASYMPDNLIQLIDKNYSGSMLSCATRQLFTDLLVPAVLPRSGVSPRVALLNFWIPMGLVLTSCLPPFDLFPMPLCFNLTL